MKQNGIKEYKNQKNETKRNKDNNKGINEWNE